MARAEVTMIGRVATAMISLASNKIAIVRLVRDAVHVTSTTVDVISHVIQAHVHMTAVIQTIV